MRLPLALSCLAVVATACADVRDDAARAPAPVLPSATAAPSTSTAAAPPPAPVACTAREVAIDGACAPLPDDVEASDLLAPGLHGVWNAWSTIAPLAPASLEKVAGPALDLDPVGGAAAARATCDRDGFVNGAGKRGRDRGPGASLHLAWLVASREVEADLWGSVVGELEVHVGDAPPVRFREVRGGGGRALLDEAAARVRIPRGATPIAVRHRRDEARSGGFYLRLRDPRGGTPSGIRLAQRVASARCAPADLIDARPEIAPVLDGERPALAITLRPAFQGLAPHDAADLRLSADLPVRRAKGNGAKATDAKAADARATDAGAPAHTGALSTASLVDGSAQARLVMATPTRGEATIAVRVEGADRPPIAELPARAQPKDLHARVARLVDAVAAGGADLPGARASLAHHVDVLAQAVARGERDARWLEEHTRRAEDVAAALSRGEDPYPAARGAVFRAYRSPLDGELQPYVAIVPPSADRGEPLPVVVVAHGMDRLPEHALRTLVGHPPDDTMSLDFAAKHLPRVPDHRAILVAPWQHGDAGPHAPGEADLARVLDDVAATWPVDEARVSITGYSLGGTVAFVGPVRSPDRFSAAAPLCGYPNLMDYRSVRDVPKAPWEPALLAREYVVGMLENAHGVPFHVVHGGKDGPARSKVVVDRLRELSQPVVWNLIDDADHDVWTDAYEEGKMIGWLTRHRRPLAPRRVRLVTGEYRVDRSAWLRILGLDDAIDARGGAGALASVDASFDPEAATLTIAARGVTALLVDRARLPDAAGRPADPGPVRVVVDGRDLGEVPPGRPIALARGDDGALGLVPEVPSRAGMKRHGVSGPLEDAFFHPLIVVRGTADPAQREAGRLVAEHLATAGGTAAVRIPVITDEQATLDALRGRSVVLVGGPPSNHLARRWEAALPARFEAGAITVRGVRHEGADVAVSLVAPRPDDPDRVVVLHGALSERGLLAARSLPRYLPDWVVYDARIAAERGGLLFGDRPTLAGGFFDASWR